MNTAPPAASSAAGGVRLIGHQIEMVARCGEVLYSPLIPAVDSLGMCGNNMDKPDTHNAATPACNTSPGYLPRSVAG